MRPPRALVVPFRHGHPLGAGDAGEQHRVLEAMLAMLEQEALAPPAIVRLDEVTEG